MALLKKTNFEKFNIIMQMKKILNLLKLPIKEEMKMEQSYLINNNFIDILKKMLTIKIIYLLYGIFI